MNTENEKKDYRCVDCLHLEFLKRKGFMAWCVVLGEYVAPNTRAETICKNGFIKDERKKE